jgi:hypothetical protein
MKFLQNQPISDKQSRCLPMSGRRGSNSRPIAWKAIALPTELLPLLIQQTIKSAVYLWGEQDSNLRSITTTELQSVPFGRSGISPKIYNQTNLFSLPSALQTCFSARCSF